MNVRTIVFLSELQIFVHMFQSGHMRVAVSWFSMCSMFVAHSGEYVGGKKVVRNAGDWTNPPGVQAEGLSGFPRGARKPFL